MAGKRKLGSLDAASVTGGAKTDVNRALVPAGGFSWMQNIRLTHPGIEQRRGQVEHNATADGTNEVLSLFQFSKGKRTERHFFAQMSDGDILESSAAPPTVIAGPFGAEVHDGGQSQKPGSWSNLNDICLHSNSVNQHLLSAGLANNVRRFVVVNGTQAIPAIPEEGFDYTTEVTDGDSTTEAVLDELNTVASYDAVFFCCPIPANRCTPGIGSYNDQASTLTISYMKATRTWTDASATDGTASAGKTLAKQGSIYWSNPSDEVPSYMFGISGFWYRMSVSAKLGTDVDVYDFTYGTDHDGAGTRSSFRKLQNVWDGFPEYAIEIKHWDASASVMYTFPGDQAEIDSMTSGDKLYFNSPDGLEGIYVDVGEKPNTTSSTTVNSVYMFDGDSWVAASGLVDNTAGLSKNGWITWQRGTQKPSQFDNAKYYSHWFYLTVDQTLSDDVIISIETMPYFSIDDVGSTGYTNSAWKGRGVYSFGDQYCYASAQGQPMVLNGDDFGILEAGDGRNNKVVAMATFYNELMVWQEERGLGGGCLTLFEGYSPTTFGKLILSTTLGTFSAKTVAVVDGVLTSTRTDDVIKTLAFFLTRHGVAVTDGRTVYLVSDDISNYFNPIEDECIRQGYEDKMWLFHDKSKNVIRIGLVSGSSATKPNVFPVLDLREMNWSFDTPAQELSVAINVEAATGDLPILQYGGGIDDGKVYKLNTGNNDVSTAIDSHVTLEFSKGAKILQLRRMVTQTTTQSAGNLSVTPYRNGVAGTALSLPMTAEQSGDEVRRHRVGMAVEDQQISLKIGNSTAGQTYKLLKLGAELYEKESH